MHRGYVITSAQPFLNINLLVLIPTEMSHDFQTSDQVLLFSPRHSFRAPHCIPVYERIRNLHILFQQ